MGGRCSPEAEALQLGHTLGAECSPVGEKCPFGHKKGCVCSPEAVALHLGHTGGARCSPEAAALQLGHILGAECSPVEEKCPFGHKMGGRCSPEAAMVHLGNISGRNLYFCESSEHFMERNIYGREHTPDEKYMLEALKEARKAAQRDEVPIGAVVVCGGRIIARAHNLTEALSDATAHAEMQAITMAAAAVGGKYLDKCTLYVTVEPCPMCAAALAWSQVKRVVYGAADDKRGYSKFTPSLMHPKTEVTGGVLAEECGNVVTDFFRQKR